MLLVNLKTEDLVQIITPVIALVAVIIIPYIQWKIAKPASS